MSTINLSYDDHADVLYLALGAPVPALTDEDDNGLLLRFATSDGHPCGVTVLGYRESHWNERVNKLSELVSSHLHIPTKEVQRALARI